VNRRFAKCSTRLFNKQCSQQGVLLHCRPILAGLVFQLAKRALVIPLGLGLIYPLDIEVSPDFRLIVGQVGTGGDRQSFDRGIKCM